MITLIDNLLTLLQTKFTTTFKSYNFGRIDIPGISSLPMIYVSPISTLVENSGTVKDNNTFTVEVVVLASLRQFFDNTNGEGTTIDALRQLAVWVEDRETTGEVKAGTIIGVIRQNITFTNAILFNNEINVSYDDYLEDGEEPKVKATIRFTAITRSNRT